MTSAASQVTLARGARTQARVIGALIMREIVTRYGRHNIGFMWIFVDPMLFTTGVILLWSLLRSHVTTLPIVAFTITGYSTVLLWRNTINRCGCALEPNRALLHHRNVRVLDLYVARLLLEIAGATLSFFILSFALIFAGVMQLPDDILKMLAAWLLLAWFAFTMGLLIGSLAVVSESVERVWHVISYLFLPLSGAFYMVDWLSTRFQTAAMLIPTVNCTELLREGYFGGSVHAHYDIPYILGVNLVLTAVALASIKGVSRTVEGE